MKKPLAYRMRPKTLDGVLGQKNIVGKNGFLTHCLENNVVVNCILFGPPGVGKTTIGEAFANSIKAHAISLNATTSNKQDLLNAFAEAKMYEDTIIILDEIHRLNKDKQDLLLPRIEDGSVYLIGATTANPLLSINPSIRSRCHLLEVKPLSVNEIVNGLKKAISAPAGLDSTRNFAPAALEVIAQASGGDLRHAYNILEAASLSFAKTHKITAEDILSISSIPNYYGDKDGNDHYNSVSAFQKSIRGSQVDAAIYYLAKLCASGDLEGTIRRLLVTAYEDIGLANPQAVDRTFTACQVAREVGMPEAIIPLAFTVADLALSPKSRSSTDAIHMAIEDIKKYPREVRDYLKLTPVSQQPEDKYPYDRPDLWELIQYLPEGLENKKYFIPGTQGNYQKSLSLNYNRLTKIARSSSLRLLKQKHQQK